MLPKNIPSIQNISPLITGVFVIVIVVSFITYPVRAQTTADANNVTETALKNLIPKNIDGWKIGDIKLKPRSFFHEPQLGIINFSKEGKPYPISVYLVYDTPEQQKKWNTRNKKRFLSKISQLKSAGKGAKTIYAESVEELGNIGKAKISMAEVDMIGETLYITRKKNEDHTYMIQTLSIFAGGMSIAVTICEEGRNCKAKDVIEATDNLIAVMKSLDFEKLSVLQPLPFNPPNIDAPEGYSAHYLNLDNTIVGFAVPDDWVFEKTTDNGWYQAYITKQKLSAKDEDVLSSISNLARHKNVKFQLFMPGNVLIWFNTRGYIKNRLSPESINISLALEWLNHKLTDPQIIQNPRGIEKFPYHGVYYTVSGKAEDGNTLIYKTIFFRDADNPESSQFGVYILRPRDIPADVQQNIKTLLNSINLTMIQTD